MSPSGEVSNRLVKPLPGPLVEVRTRFAPNSKSIGLVVLTNPLLLVPLLPVLVALTSTGVVRSAPLYSNTLTSAYLAAVENVTVTVLPPEAAATILLA